MTTATKIDYRKLHRRLLRTMLLICLIPLLLVGGAGYLQFDDYARRTVLELQERLVLNHRDFIDSYLQSRRAELVAITNRYTLDELLAGELEQVYSVIEQGTGIYTDIGIIDDQGNHLKYVGPYDLGGRNYRSADWFAALRTQDLVVSDLFMGYRAVPHFIIAVKRTTPTGYWILRATLSTDYFSQLVEAIRVGSTGEAFLLDRQGRYQTKTQFGGALLQASGYPHLGPHSGVRTAEVAERGRVFLCSDVWTAGDQWLLVFRQDKAEAYGPLLRAVWVWAVITLVAVAGVVLASLGLSSRLVSHVKRADVQKDQIYAQLIASSKLAAVGEMAAGVAHEINNPLANIETLRTWILDLVTEQGISGADLQEVTDAARKIGDQVERCRRITHDLLRFSRGSEAERVSTDINGLLREMIQMAEHRARGENIIFTLEAGELPPIVTSPPKLQQIVLNILNNAIDAMEGKGGTVTVMTRRSRSGIQIDFKDSGCGIPPGNLSRIFQPFFTTKPVGQGTGLGLAVCYGLVRQMGGNLEVQSRVGIGSTFTLTLPLESPLEPA